MNRLRLVRALFSMTAPRLPPLSSTILFHIAADWAEFADIRAAARALSHKSRLVNAVSIVSNEIRVALAAALLCTDRSSQPATVLSRDDESHRLDTIQHAARLYAHARAAISDCAEPMATEWHMSESQIRIVRDALGSVVGGVAASPPPPPAPVPDSPPRPLAQAFDQGTQLFLAAVAQGMPLGSALAAFAHFGSGHFSHDDKSFYPANPTLGAVSDRVRGLHHARRFVVQGAEGEGDTTLFLVDGAIAAVTSTHRIRTGWLDDCRRSCGGLESLPDFIALPRDEEGRPIIPETRVTALVEAREAWATQLGTLDGVTRAITRGQLVMPRVSAPSQRTALRNHPSWENDEAAKRALGPVIAKWLATGVLEYVGWDDRVPILLQPCGAVPKGTAPFFRLITDARFANKFYSDWGVTYTTASQLSSTLNRCDFHFSIDISDAYHLSLWAGCGGELRPTRRPIITSRGPGLPNEVSWVDALVNGCDPSTCKGGCDKDLSGIVIEGHIFRFAACQFGQKTAGSPLGSIVRAVARFFARLADPIHVASWVDDLIFIMATPEHGECAGFDGGCPVCEEYYGRALKAQQLWVEKAKALKIPLSAKGHEVGQRGTYTGVGIDTFTGRFSMLPDKLASMTNARSLLAASSVSTPRLVARVRGKALHYGCAIPFVAIAAPSLSQLMHNRESGTGPVEVPTLEAERDLEFDWDKELTMSDRAMRALDFMRVAMEKYSARGQPIWPVVPSSLYGAFLAGEDQGLRLLLITFDASVHGWAAVLQTARMQPGRVIVGGYRQAMPLLRGDFIDPAALPDCPAAQVYREALAGFLATKAASKIYALADYTVLIRSDCLGAIAALRKGSFRSPALQNIALLHNSMLMELGVLPPSYLHIPGETMKAEGVDDLSRATARACRGSESSAALRSVVVREAERLGAVISIDLFATADNALVPRFFARFPEPLAEGVDALAQPDWGRSECPRCGSVHRECVFAFPPRPLLSSFVAKARADGMRGVVVVPFTPSDPAWPVLEAVSLTSIEGQRDRCVIVACSTEFVSEGTDLGGAQRLAVMAVDFSRHSRRSFAGVAAPCERFREVRPRPALQGSGDAGVHSRLAAALLRFSTQGGGRKRPLAARGW